MLDWYGMVLSCLKNFFLYCGVKEIVNKLGLIIVLFVLIGGYLFVVELCISSSKNNCICWIFDYLIICNVKVCFNILMLLDDKDDIYI